MPVDDKGYETSDSVIVHGHTIHQGDHLRCQCLYEVVRLHHVWANDTKKIIPDHPNTTFMHRILPSLRCPLHCQMASAK